MRVLRKILFFSILSISLPLEARLIQILHTNDVHSFFEHSDHQPAVGGYARLKSLIEKYKKEGLDKNIPTLVVDAGDFMEGNLFYMAGEGRRSFDIQNQMGYDAVVVGNHDYLMGTQSLDDIVGDVPPNFAYLGANMVIHDKYTNLKNHMRPYKEFEIDGIKLAFLGLTTDEIVFEWRVTDGKINKPISVAKKYEKILKKRGNNVVIALTHLGLKKDKKLAKKTKYIDLVIGGHSHDSLYRPYFQKNRLKKKVPIVQAGQHGEKLGRIIIDIDKNGIRKVVKYELIDVVNIDKDEEVDDYVQETKKEVEDYFGKKYLEELVGYSALQRSTENVRMLWSFYVTEAMLDSVGSQVSMHTPGMTSGNFPIGDITRKDVMNSHPRWFDFKDKFGWYVYRAKVPGVLIKAVFQAVMNLGIPLSISGVTFKWKKNIFGKKVVRNIRINGKRIRWWKGYDMAFPEGVIRGGLAISPLVGWILRKSYRTKVTVFDAIEAKIKRDGTIPEDYLNSSNKENMKSTGRPIDRVFIPAN
jgi:5'-nucleotidase / UDP-sugar diphosphatase